MVQVITGPLTTKEVYEVNTKVYRNVLTQVDLEKVLGAFSSIPVMG